MFPIKRLKYFLEYIGIGWLSVSADMEIVYRYRHRYRPIRKLYLSVLIGIGRYEKRLIVRPLHLSLPKIIVYVMVQEENAIWIFSKKLWRWSFYYFYNLLAVSHLGGQARQDTLSLLVCKGGKTVKLGQTNKSKLF